MKRKMYNRLLQWKEHSRGRTALLIQLAEMGLVLAISRQNPAS